LKKTCLNQLKLISGASIILVLVMIHMACSREFYNIKWNGVIVDGVTNKPIPFASIKATAKHQNNIDHTIETSKAYQSDIWGHFQGYFDKAYQINYEIEAYGYMSVQARTKPNQHAAIDTIRLLPEVSQSNLFISLLSEQSFEDQPFLRSRTITPFNGRKKNSNTEVVGFDFINQKHAIQPDSMDLKIIIRNRFTPTPSVHLYAMGTGGIYPIFLDEINESFFLEMECAPTEGYYPSYKIAGNEAGFFIRCRNGQHYVKILPDDHICSIAYSTSSDSIQETGLRLNYLIQRDTIYPTLFPVMAVYDYLSNQSLSTELIESKQTHKTTPQQAN